MNNASCPPATGGNASNQTNDTGDHNFHKHRHPHMHNNSDNGNGGEGAPGGGNGTNETCDLETLCNRTDALESAVDDLYDMEANDVDWLNDTLRNRTREFRNVTDDLQLQVDENYDAIDYILGKLETM